MQYPNRFLVFLGWAVAIVVVAGCEAGSAQGPSMAGAPFSVADVNRDRDTLIGRRIAITGRVHAQPRPGDEQSRGADSFPATLHLVDATQSSGTPVTLDVYRRTSTGQYEPVMCQVGDGVIRCGAYTPEAVTTITGTWRRERLPSGQIVYPDGRMVPSASRVAYFLLVD